MNVKKAWKTFARILRSMVMIAGVVALLMLVLSFTDIPFYAYYNLGTAFTADGQEPDVIVVMGGAGMPTPDGLIRTYYGAELARQFPQAGVVIALPIGNYDSTRQLDLMAEEFTSEGIDSSRITYESSGFNTRSQALNVARMYPGKRNELNFLVITSPEHVYRSVKAFRKAGMAKTYGYPAMEVVTDEKSLEDKEGRQFLKPDLDIRYNMWSYLKYELIVMREYLAIAYYQLRGWI